MYMPEDAWFLYSSLVRKKKQTSRKGTKLFSRSSPDKDNGTFSVGMSGPRVEEWDKPHLQDTSKKDICDRFR